MPPHDPIGLLIPFRRDRKRDFATASGPDLLAAKVRQVLLTEGATAHSSGELPWRTSFGSALHLLRHRPNDAALAELARLHIRDALARWLPEVELVAVTVNPQNVAQYLRVRWKERNVQQHAGTLDEMHLLTNDSQNNR